MDYNEWNKEINKKKNMPTPGVEAGYLVPNIIDAYCIKG